MKSNTYKELVNKMEQISSLSPQRFGILDPLYHYTVPFLKDSSWRMLIFAAVFASIILYVVFGDWTVKLASTLQYGF